MKLTTGDKKGMTTRWYREMLVIPEDMFFCNESQNTSTKGNDTYQVIEGVKMKLKDTVS